MAIVNTPKGFMRLAANLGIVGMLSQAQCYKTFDLVKLTLCKVFESEKHFHPSLSFVSAGETYLQLYNHES